MSANLDKYGNVPDALRDYHGGPNKSQWGPKGEAYVKNITSKYNAPASSAPMDDGDGTGVGYASKLAASAPASPTAAPAASSAPAEDDGTGVAYAAQLAANPPQAKASAAPAQKAQMTPQQIEASVTPSQTPVADAAGNFLHGAMAIPKGVYQGFRAVTDTGLQGASRAVDAAAGTSFAPQADANAAKAKADFEAQYGGNDLASILARTGKVGGEMAATAPVLGAKIVQGGGMLANGINGAVQGGLAGAALSSQSNDSLASQVGTGAVAGGVLGAAIPAIANKFEPFLTDLGASVNSLKKTTGLNALTDKIGLTSAASRAAGGAPVNLTADQSALARESGSEAAQVRKADADAAAAAATAAKPKFKLNTDGSMMPIPKEAPATTAAPAASIPPYTPPQAPSSPTSTQALANTQTLKDIGLDTARPSAISGDKRSAGTEYQQSKLNTEQGDVLNEQLQKEQGALKGYASKIVANTGSTSTSPEQVGQTVRAPLSGLSDYYDSKISGLYKTADQRAAGAAVVQPNDFGKMLGTDSNFAGKDSNVALRRGINAYAREQGIIGTDGSLQPMTVEKAEGLRQYINSNWSPENSGLIGKIKQSLDQDVGTAGGADIYKAARALHAERANTLDNPKGISSLLNESGPGGINKSVPDELVGKKMINMPTQQFQHVVNTLKNLPDELQGQGQQALSEIKGAIAKQIYSAGDAGGTQAGASAWNAANVTRALNANRSKMAEVFTPEELAQFQTLHDAGHILQAPSSYPGAAVQGHNLAQKGLLVGASMGGGALGHAMAGPYGGFVGMGIGGFAQNKLAQSFEKSAANKLRESMVLR